MDLRYCTLSSIETQKSICTFIIEPNFRRRRGYHRIENIEECSKHIASDIRIISVIIRGCTQNRTIDHTGCLWRGIQLLTDFHHLGKIQVSVVYEKEKLRVVKLS